MSPDLMSPGERASRQQLRASDPRVSAFVAASAGSGKTKLLTDRLLRLMLSGADPARIQCLTFTKAAAAEMALRLQRRLGGWVMLDDAGLDRQLVALEVTPDADLRGTARALFARVLDLPGGMRIGTIHAFCQSLLRRFPLEAALSPHFQLVDDRDATIALQDAREAMLAQSHTAGRRAALEQLAGLTVLDGFGKLVDTLQSNRARLELLRGITPERRHAMLWRALGATHPHDLSTAVAWAGESDLRLTFGQIAQRATPAAKQKAARILGWLDLDAEARAENWAAWQEEFLTKYGEDRELGAFIKGKIAGDFPDLANLVDAEQARIRAVVDGWRAAKVAELSEALISLALPVAQGYAAAKQARGLLDYDDLISRTAKLLLDPGAAWVLFKLDGGLDHLLLDEVQDTAPAQWDIAGSLTGDFFAGAGARDGVSRTVFAVGDRKQSIYGFQGARPEGFEAWRGILRQRVQDGGQQWADVELDVSFRSTRPVLALVDAVFAQPMAAEGVTEAGRLHHIADRGRHAGLVELWPITPRPEEPKSEPWDIPHENQRQVSAVQRLADALATWIDAQIRNRTILASRGRPIGAGDILVLVRQRGVLPRMLLRALKVRGVPVAGLDRMVLTEQPAVADLMALGDTLLLPQDDLQLACVLTSPLGGLTDDQLMNLAAGRRGTLWEALRTSTELHCQTAWRFIDTLFARVDHASPHALLSEALGPLGGRARLFARLGPEAAEPVDELLAAALRHGQSHPPSLQHFLHWLRQSATEVKREAESPAGHGFDAVRIMTVHGAKGLQAPLVILPDTTGLPPDRETVVWVRDPDSDGAVELPAWCPQKALRCETANRLRTEAQTRRSEEQNRLLYVALTRAEDRLLICGWQSRRNLPDDCWYNHVARGFEALAADAVSFAAIPDPWPGEQRSIASPQLAEPERELVGIRELSPVLPSWAGAAPAWIASPLPIEPALPSPLAPSRPEGVDLGAVPEAASPLLERDMSGRRFRRGQLVHSLLQHLPALPVAERHAAAVAFLARPGLGEDNPSALVREVMGVLDHAGLAPLFGPHGRAEVPLSGVIAGQVIGGLIDRLAVLPHAVWIADYKTNRRPPADAASTPVLYLRQMAAYRAVVQAIFPGRDIHCLLVWTVGAQVMLLPPGLLDGHAPEARAAA